MTVAVTPSDSLNTVVSQLIDVLKTKVSEFKYNQWLKPARFSAEGQRLQITVPNKFVRDWIAEHYLQLVQYEMYRLTQTEYEINLVVAVLPPELPPPVAPGKGVYDTLVSQLEIAATAASPAAPGTSSPSAPAPRPAPLPTRLQGLNSKYTFDSFIVGNSNQFCHAAARSVAENPGMTYNPLFVYGGVGLGKTHLLNAIGLKIFQETPAKRVLSVTGEQFTNELIGAIRYETTADFRKKYRESCDILLIDDIQFIAGKERTQEEFFHTFNTLYESRRQIVLTSDRSPRDIQHLEDRLRSRFNWGLIADIQVPDTETRVAILRRRADASGVELPDSVAYLIADKVRSNVRDLEGAFNRLSAFSVLYKCELTPDLAAKILEDLISEKAAIVSFERIQQLVAEHYKVKVDDLTSSRRFKTIAEPRQIAMYLCKKFLKTSFPEIGQHFGGKDHSTVIHAVRKVTKDIEDNPSLQASISQLEKSLSLQS